MHEDIEKQLDGFRLTTAEITYHMPDHPDLLQTFLWQEYDIVPEFPELHKFLGFWESNIEGKLHSVKVAHKRLIMPAQWKPVDGDFTLH